MAGNRPSPEAAQLVKQLMQIPENSICADCQKKAAKWASSTLGVFICIDCSGIHRSMGTHVSFVRSCTLDSWTPDQARLMRRVGNKKGNAFWEARLPLNFTRPLSSDRLHMEQFIRAKYIEKRWAAPGDPPSVPKQNNNNFQRAQQNNSSQKVLSNSASDSNLNMSAFDFLNLSHSNRQNQQQNQPSSSSAFNWDDPSNIPPNSPKISNQNTNSSVLDFLSEQSKQSPQQTPQQNQKQTTLPNQNQSNTSQNSKPVQKLRPRPTPVQPSQAPPPTPPQQSNFDFMNNSNQAPVYAQSKGPSQHAFKKQPRFAKKSGDDVIDGMLYGGSQYRPVSAPTYQTGMFAGLSVSGSDNEMNLNKSPEKKPNSNNFNNNSNFNANQNKSNSPLHSNTHRFQKNDSTIKVQQSPTPFTFGENQNQNNNNNNNNNNINPPSDVNMFAGLNVNTPSNQNSNSGQGNSIDMFSGLTLRQ